MSYGGHLYITPTGFQNLKDKLDELDQEKVSIGQELHEAQEIGRPEENASYELARTRQLFVDTHIAQTRELLKEAVLIKKPRRREQVRLGHTIKLKGEGKIVHYTLVGSVEADPQKGLISDQSPAGQQLMGKRTGEQVEIGNGHIVTYTILDIS